MALLLGRPVLLIYAAAFLAITFVLVHWIEDPALVQRFGQQFGDYRKQCPAGGPACDVARPDVAPNTTTRGSV